MSYIHVSYCNKFWHICVCAYKKANIWPIMLITLILIDFPDVFMHNIYFTWIHQSLYESGCIKFYSNNIDEGNSFQKSLTLPDWSVAGSLTPNSKVNRHGTLLSKYSYRHVVFPNGWRFRVLVLKGIAL